MVRWDALAGLLEDADRHEELAGVWRRLTELVPPERRAECLDALARLLEGRLDDLSSASDTLLELADDENAPADVEDRIESLLERTARHEELAARLAVRARDLPTLLLDTVVTTSVVMLLIGTSMGLSVRLPQTSTSHAGIS